MTTCPRCGRVADDEIVCPNCGMSLALARLSAAQSAPGLMDDLGAEAGAEVGAEEGADESEGSSRDVKMWRLAALVCLTCLLAATTAIVLLNQHGSDNTPFGLPLTSAPASDSPIGTSPATSSTSGAASGSTKSTTSTPSKSTSPTATRSTSSPASRTSAQGAAPAVRLVRGGLDQQCGPHCYSLVVTLSAFPSGAHAVACYSAREGLFDSYTTSAIASAGCAYKRPRDSVWVIVDHTYRSNTVSW